MVMILSEQSCEKESGVSHTEKQCTVTTTALNGLDGTASEEWHLLWSFKTQAHVAPKLTIGIVTISKELASP